MEFGNVLMTLLVVALLIVSTIQAFQLSQLREKVDEFTTLSKNSGNSVSTGTTLKQNINNLPSMVGGC